MTTPNNQPTPPEGMRLLTPEEYKNRLPEDSVYSPDGENWYKSGNIGKRPFIQHIYAIPITPTVPATGDTTNEKGGEQRQELLPCPFCGASDWKQDNDISYWRVLTHKPECFLAEDKLGRTRQEIISLPNKEAQQWNTRK